MDKEIIHVTLQNLMLTAGVDGLWNHAPDLDGTLLLTLNNKKTLFTIEIKNEIRWPQIHLLEQNNTSHKNYLLMANRIYPKVKEVLRLKNICYVEANGNVFIKNNNYYLFIDTQKPINTVKDKANRAFTKTGLKVLFYLLQHKDYINFTHRELAEKSNVALGNIPLVIDGLKATGFVTPLNDKKYLWNNRDGLLEKWVNDYGTRLKPQLIKERYTFMDNNNIILNNKLSVWGGEPAAEFLTQYLRPEKYIIYTKESRSELIKNYRLKPNPAGEILVIDMFWNHNQKDAIAPPLLIYADLLLEGGKRNLETAKIIFNEYIKSNL